jgi:hypothetical protein
MFRKIAISSILTLLLISCSWVDVSLPAVTPLVSSSPLPAIHSPTPPFVASVTSTPIVLTPTTTAAATVSPTPSATLPLPGLTLEIYGCNTSLDILHGMGEVTNAYPVLRNQTGVELTNLCATLSASDEGRPHPDKTACVVSLQNGYQVMLKLTVDTTFKQNTSIQVDVTSREGYSASISTSSCRDIDMPGETPGGVGVIQPIP